MTTTSDEPPRPPQTASRVVVSVILVVVAIAIGVQGFRMLQALKEPPSRESRVPIRTAVLVQEAARTNHRETLIGYGRARALRSAQVSAELAANIVWVAPELEAGASVSKGTALVRLDESDARSALQSAHARARQAAAARVGAAEDLKSLSKQVRKAADELELARRELARLEELFPRAATESEIDQQRMQTSIRDQAVVVLEGRAAKASADLDRADADGAVAAADIERAELDVTRTTVHAPFRGVIEARHARLGERATPGTVLFDIINPKYVEVPIALPAARHGDVRVGGSIELRLREEGVPVWRGSVMRVAPAVDTESRTFLAFVEVTADPKNPQTVVPGAFVVGHVAGPTTLDVIVIPREAFVDDRVYVAVPSGEGDEATVAERRPEIVKLLPDVALVRGGIDSGELIVVTNVEDIADGGRVRLVRDSRTEK